MTASRSLYPTVTRLARADEYARPAYLDDESADWPEPPVEDTHTPAALAALAARAATPDTSHD